MELELEALALSVRVATLAVVCSLPAGIGMGWLLARVEFPGKSVVDGLVDCMGVNSLSAEMLMANYLRAPPPGARVFAVDISSSRASLLGQPKVWGCPSLNSKASNPSLKA